MPRDTTVQKTQARSLKDEKIASQPTPSLAPLSPLVTVFLKNMVASVDKQAPLAVVVGVTGNQGGSVANALIESTKPYRIVGLTRDPSKPAAQVFGNKGVELYQVDLVVGNEMAVTKAFEEADVVFVSRSGRVYIADVVAHRTCVLRP